MDDVVFDPILGEFRTAFELERIKEIVEIRGGGSVSSTDSTPVVGGGLGDPGSNGMLARTALNTTVARTLTGTANQITITNGDGVSGNPTFSTPQDIHTGASPTFAGAVLAGTTVVYSTDLYATIQLAVTAIQTAGGGVLIIPEGVYTETISITRSEPIKVIGNGATLQASANNQTMITVNQGVTSGNRRSSLEGITISGSGYTGVTGVLFEDTVGGIITDFYINNCATGIVFENVDAGAYSERNFVHDSFITTCSTGIDFTVSGGSAMPSFNECALVNVGVTGCDVGINQNDGADFTRTTWVNVSIWPAENGYGVKFDGRLDHSRLAFGVEALPGLTGVTGVYVGANYTHYSSQNAHDLSISFVGEFEDKVVDDSAGGGIAWSDGQDNWVSKYATSFMAQKISESYPRFKMTIAGLEFGVGSALPPIKMEPWYDNYMNMTGNFVFKDLVSIGTDVEPTEALDVAGNIKLSGKLTTTGNIELGHATDTTLSRVSAGKVAIEGSNILTEAGGTMTGDIQLGETDIKLDAVLSGDEKWSGITMAGTAGATIAVGDVCYLASSGKWLLNDGILDGTDTGFSKQLGICVLAASGDTEPTEILLYGKIRSAAFPAFTVGTPVYLDDTAGDLVVAQPSTTNFAIRIVGYAITAEDLLFNPSNDYIVHA